MICISNLQLFKNDFQEDEVRSSGEESTDPEADKEVILKPYVVE